MKTNCEKKKQLKSPLIEESLLGDGGTSNKVDDSRCPEPAGPLGESLSSNERAAGGDEATQLGQIQVRSNDRRTVGEYMPSGEWAEGGSPENNNQSIAKDIPEPPVFDL